MKISSSLLSIPPYLSTTWENIASLHIREEEQALYLVVTLQNQIQVEIPDLAPSVIDSIFAAHARYTESKPSPQTPFSNPLEGPFSFSLPLKGPIESLGTSMQHNPEQADLPPMEPELLKKITMIARAFGLDQTSALPPAEPSCNCIYCQVHRGLSEETAPLAEASEEVTEEDLKFRNWEIEQTADKLYNVTNPLDNNEHYSVFLGNPLGCTCGQKNCEHIRAVLST